MGQTLKIMTYNVHSCIGLDRKASTARVAEVMMQEKPDVIAIQELDMHLQRTGRIYQARSIAIHLKMDFHFHPALHIEGGQYGNAILTALPSRLVQSQHLPTFAKRFKTLEPRGALWVEIQLDRNKLQIMNTHLGLRRKERSRQVADLLGPQWLRHPGVRNPVLLCGDMNSTPRSREYGKLDEVLCDVQKKNGEKIKKTWPSWFPVTRIDHIFTSHDIEIVDVRVVNNRASRRASDHLPLMAEMNIPDRREA